MKFQHSLQYTVQTNLMVQTCYCNTLYKVYDSVADHGPIEDYNLSKCSDPKGHFGFALIGHHDVLLYTWHFLKPLEQAKHVVIMNIKGKSQMKFEMVNHILC